MIVEDNVNVFPALLTHGAPWVRIMSCNPLEMKDPDAAADVQRLPDRRPRAAGRTTAPSTTGRTARRGSEYERLRGASRARRRCPTSSSSTSPTHLNLSCIPRSRTTRARGRSAPTWHRLESSVRATDEPLEVPDELRGGDGRARLPLARLARLRRRRADAAARRGPGRDAAPVRRVEGPARRRVRPAGHHVGRGPRAADVHHPARRPRDHPRRQQHDDRGVPLRQADDRAAAVLGPVRQRAARPGDSGSACGCRRTRSRTTSCARRSTGSLDDARAAVADGGSGERIRAQDGTRRAADLIEAVARA